MPFVKVSLHKGRTAAQKDAIATAIQSALVSAVDVAENNRYQVFKEYDAENFRHTPGYLGLTYSDALLIIEITVREGDDEDHKKALLAAINRNLVAAGVVGGDDVFVLLTEIGNANASFGRGLAQRAPAPPRARDRLLIA